ncbi:MAG: two-component regulator propeller domain-containing protein [Draconibacterium sp.]
MKYKFLIFIFLFFVQVLQVRAGIDYRFRTVSPEGGFYYDGVKSIQQDKDGFIWILMENELYRFDGYAYKRYFSKFATTDQTKEWEFLNTDVDHDGQLYVATNNGLHLYNRKLDDFMLLEKGRVERVKIDSRNNIWIRKNKRWHLYDRKANTFKTATFHGKNLSYISPVFCTYNKDLYLFSNFGRIYRYNYTKNDFTLCTTLPEPDGLVLDAKAHKGKLWVLVRDYGLYCIDLASFTLDKHIDFAAVLSEDNVRSFHIDKNDMLWLGTMNGLFVMNAETEQYQHFKHSRTDKFSIPNNSIWTISEDAQQNIWIGTYAGAVSYVHLDEKNPIKSYIPQPGKLNYIPVSGFASGEQFLWIATEGAGINRMDKASGEFAYLSHTEQANSLSHNNVKSMVLDKNQNLWIGTYSGGLNKYTPGKAEFKHFLAENPDELISDDIRKLVLESDSGLWIIYQRRRQEISYLSFSDESFSHFELGGEDTEHYIFDAIREGENLLWMISSNRIFRMNVKTKEVAEIVPPDSTFMNFRTFCLDDSGNLWLGTLSNGIVKYNPYSGTFTRFNDMEKYGIFSVFNICYDSEGSLWLGTDNGLIRYNIGDKTYFRYDKHDGTQGDVYYPLAVMKNTDGNLYFGGTKGFTIVDPKSLTFNTKAPRVIISEFLIGQTTAAFDLMSDNQENVAEVTLKYNQTNFGFRFSSDNYLIPQKTRFKYRLKAYDDRWIEIDASNRTAMYSKVPPGVYYFEVLAANNDGIWNEVPKRIKVIRKPAPWLSWPAYLLYTVLAALLAGLILRYYSERKKLQLQLYLENVEKQKNKAIYESQLQFFTNISHDFKTPLSLIIAALQKLRREGLKEYYYRILNGNAQRLLNLVNELMDFRTVENGKMKLELQPANLNLLVEEVASGFADYARQRNIVYEIFPDPQLSDEVWIDKKIVEKVMMNLLNNAFKSTQNKGRISVKIYTAGEMFVSQYSNSCVINTRNPLTDAVQLVISDNGTGISDEALPRVFERFYTNDSGNSGPQLGTGIGLALVKSLVLLHKGQITVFSEPGMGTDVVVALPTSKAIFPPECFGAPPVAGKAELPADAIDAQDDPLEEDIENLLPDEKQRILLVEDNNDLRELIAGYLSEEFQVLEAADGVEALAILSAKIIDLVISDIMMPRKDGIALSREMKDNIETSHIPVVLLTAKTGLESKLEGVESGADLYFEKPVDLNLLKISVQNIFRQRSLLKEYFAKNFFADSAELSSNERDNKFLKDFIQIVESHIDESGLDVNFIASELSMSRSKLYRKIKSMTDKSIVEFILNIRLRKAARIIIEEDLSMREVMEKVGIESQPYFTNAFKKEFGETPTAFASKHKGYSGKK